MYKNVSHIFIKFDYVLPVMYNKSAPLLLSSNYLY